MDEIIQIKCPFDGAVLSVKNFPGIEMKNVTCPICKNKYPFTKFTRVVRKAAQEDDCTHYGPNVPASNPGNSAKCTSVGTLREESRGMIFYLRPGRNVIGRQAMKSKADVQIYTGERMELSREHLVIDVVMDERKGYVHYLSLYKAQVNPTFIGNNRIYFGDQVELRDGEVINLPGISIKFEIASQE